MVNIPYHLAKAGCKINRAIYNGGLPYMVQQPAEEKGPIPVTVYSMSCERDLPEQAASIYSFLRNVGCPLAFNVVSDGSHSPQSRAILAKISPCVNFLRLEDVVNDNVPAKIADYARGHALGKKLALLWSIPGEGETIFTDSDVLFFDGAGEITTLLAGSERPWYLLDIGDALDERLLRGVDEMAHPVNSGLILFRHPLNWTVALERLEQLSGSYDYFTEQTMVHIALHSSLAQPLDPTRYILRGEDQFRFFDEYAAKGIAARHYAGGVRYKFWKSKVWH